MLDSILIMVVAFLACALEHYKAVIFNHLNDTWTASCIARILVPLLLASRYFGYMVFFLPETTIPIDCFCAIRRFWGFVADEHVIKIWPECFKLFYRELNLILCVE
jgi:hypothetical protein